MTNTKLPKLLANQKISLWLHAFYYNLSKASETIFAHYKGVPRHRRLVAHRWQHETHAYFIFQLLVGKGKAQTFQMQNRN